MAKNDCMNGCPPGIDLRNCKKVLAGECPLLCNNGRELIIGKRQQELFN